MGNIIHQLVNSSDQCLKAGSKGISSPPLLIQNCRFHANESNLMVFCFSFSLLVSNWKCATLQNKNHNISSTSIIFNPLHLFQWLSANKKKSGTPKWRLFKSIFVHKRGSACFRESLLVKTCFNLRQRSYMH